VSGAWAGLNSTDMRGWKRVNVSGLGGGRVGSDMARGASDGRRAGGGATRGGAARGGRACGEGQRGERRGTRKLNSNRAIEEFRVALFSWAEIFSSVGPRKYGSYFRRPLD
jgi:hypothetical protein